MRTHIFNLFLNLCTGAKIAGSPSKKPNRERRLRGDGAEMVSSVRSAARWTELHEVQLLTCGAHGEQRGSPTQRAVAELCAPLLFVRPATGAPVCDPAIFR